MRITNITGLVISSVLFIAEATFMFQLVMNQSEESYKLKWKSLVLLANYFVFSVVIFFLNIIEKFFDDEPSPTMFLVEETFEMLTWLLFFNICYVGTIVQIQLKARFELVEEIQLLRQYITKLTRRARCLWLLIAFIFAANNITSMVLEYLAEYKDKTEEREVVAEEGTIVSDCVTICICLIVAYRFTVINIKFYDYYKMQGDVSIKHIRNLAFLISFFLLVKFAFLGTEVYLNSQLLHSPEFAENSKVTIEHMLQILDVIDFAFHYLNGVYICKIMLFILHAQNLRANDINSSYQSDSLSEERNTEYMLSDADSFRNSELVYN